MSTHESMLAFRLAFTNVALLSATQVGGSFVPLTVIVNVWVALVSSPLFRMPPLS